VIKSAERTLQQPLEFDQENMGKFSFEDKMRIQTLCEQGLGYKRILKAYPEKQWKADSVKTICRRFQRTGSAVNRQVGSGRPKSARSEDNIDRVSQLICSQEDQPGTSKSTREIAQEVGISQFSVRQIAKKDLKLRCFKRTVAQVLSAATKQKRLERCRALLKRITVPRSKRVFFTDEKAFYLDPPVSTQNNRVWASSRKTDVAAERLLIQRSKFSQHVMVSAGVCYGGKGKLHFVPDGSKINAEYYSANLLPFLLEDCQNCLQHDFIFQQDGAPAHTARHTQEWLASNSPDFVTKDEWPPNSPDLNPLDYCVWGMMLAAYQKYRPKPTTKAKLKVVLQTIWDSLSQDSINKAILAFRKRLRACVKADGGHFEHVL